MGMQDEILYENLLNLCKSAFREVFIENVEISISVKIFDNVDNAGSHIRNIALDLIENKLKLMSEFSVCVQYISQEGYIAPLEGKLVGSKSAGAVICPNVEKCITSFLIGLSSHIAEFDTDVFDTKYKLLEEFLFSDKIRTRDICRLFNFESEVDEIEILPGFLIKRSKRKASDRSLIHSSRIFESEFIFESIRTHEKMVGNSDDEIVIDEKSQPKYLFDNLIHTFRIHKSSKIYRDNYIHGQFLTFHPYPIVGSSGSSYGNEIFGGGNYSVSSQEEAEQLVRIFTYLLEGNNARFEIAYKRLSWGMERRNPEDRLIDYAIGLESLYLPNERNELRNKLSIRAALLLRNSFDDRKEMMKSLKNIYDLRSKIVHGTHLSLKEKDVVDEAESILRESINEFILNKDRFSSTYLEELPLQTR